VVVGDTLCPGFSYPGYWSDRVYETLGRGGFLVHPRIAGLERQFTDGEHLAYYDYTDFDGLFAVIDRYLDDPAERESIRAFGHAEVHRNHLYIHRWQTILETLS
jgi:spore maturation protein CgeB